MSCLAENIVQLNLGELEGLFNGVIGTLAKVGVFGMQVTGMAGSTDLETTERYMGCGQAIRTTRTHRRLGTAG